MTCFLAHAILHGRRVVVAGAILALTAGCSRPASIQPTSSPTPEAPTVSTPSPTASASQVILVAPSDATDSSLAAQVEPLLQGLAAESAMAYQRADALPADPQGIAVVAILPPDPGVQAWAAAHPTTHVITIGLAGVQAASNLTALAPDGLRYDQIGFALGYLAAMVTPEYRLGALVLDSSPASLSLARGFVAGGTYYCGLCRPVHPPYLEYPVLLTGNGAGFDPGEITTLLVTPSPPSLSELGLPSNARLGLVGIGPPPTDLASRWIASAGFDLDSTLEAVWAGIQAGEAGTAIPLAIRYHSVNPDIVSEGRLVLAQRLLGELAAGAIDTGVDPVTGEPR